MPVHSAPAPPRGYQELVKAQIHELTALQSEEAEHGKDEKENGDVEKATWAIGHVVRPEESQLEDSETCRSLPISSG